MARTRVEVKGLRELGVSLRNLEEDLRKKIAHSSAAAGAKVIRDRARRLVPVDTGALKAGVVVKRVPKGETELDSEYIVTISTREMKKYVAKSRNAIVELQGPIAPQVINGKTYRPKKLLGRKEEYASFGDLFYAHFIEFGTVKMAARPFLRPAFDGGKGDAVQAMKRKLEARIKKAQATGK